MAEDAIARARAIAAKLSGSIGGGLSSELGKRTADHAGLGSIIKKKIYIPVKENPDVNFLGLLIGPRGTTMRAMSDKTGCKILVKGRGSQKDGADTEDDDLHVALEGSEDAVEKAVREVEDILFNPERAQQLKQEQLGGGQSSSALTKTNIYGPGPTEEETMTVPNNVVGLIIGRGGEQIQRIQQQSGGHMQIQKESDMKPGETMRVITLKGSDSSRADLRRRIEEIVNAANGPKVATRERRLEQAHVVKIVVPNEKVGIIIGRQGSTLRSIQERTRANILIPPQADEDNPENRTIQIGADLKEDADAAQAEIFFVLQQNMQAQAASIMQQNAPVNTVCITIPDDKVGLIIGKGGFTIKDLQQRCRVRLQIPQVPDPGSNPPMRTITIQGSSEGQMMARFEIESILGYTQQQPVAAIGGSYAMGSTGMYDMYGGQYAGYPQTGTDSAVAAAGSAVTAAVPNDPTAYYNDFWQYAAYYGEAAARLYYQSWSPPEGTAPPEGIVLAAAGQTVAGMDQQGVAATTVSSATTQQGQPNQSEEEKQAWEKYQREYAEWYEQHGKANGAEPPSSLRNA